MWDPGIVLKTLKTNCPHGFHDVTSGSSNILLIIYLTLFLLRCEIFLMTSAMITSPAGACAVITMLTLSSGGGGAVSVKDTASSLPCLAKAKYLCNTAVYKQIYSRSAISTHDKISESNSLSAVCLMTLGAVALCSFLIWLLGTRYIFCACPIT